MKTNNLQKKSFLTMLVLAMSAGFSAMKNGGGPIHTGPNGFIGGGSAIFIPRHGKFKGYMRENRRYNSFKKKIR